MQPLGGEQTALALPIVRDEQAIVPARVGNGARPAHKGETGLLVRRSSRKSAVLAVAGTAAVLLAARLGAVHINGYGLPSYPSAPYLLVPAIVAVVVLVFWLYTRSWVYTMNDDAAVVQWGLVGHRRFGVPLRQVATLELRQSLIDRALGVGTVELCARDSAGEERRLVMEDLPRPRQTYQDLLRMLGRSMHTRANENM